MLMLLQAASSIKRAVAVKKSDIRFTIQKANFKV